MNNIERLAQSSLMPSPLAAEQLKACAVYGQPISVAAGISVILADNAKDYTGPGTNTYLVGDEEVWIIDPGPADEKHIDAVKKAVDGRGVEGIFITHNHLDHSPAAKPLQEALNAPIYGCANLNADAEIIKGEGIDVDFATDHELSGGETIGQGRWRIDVLHTPGHFPNHLCYYLPETKTLFSGDHVMGWSTTVIVPPLGNLADYMESLSTLEKTGADRLLPSHGNPVDAAMARIREIRDHRMMRHAQVEACVARGVTEPADIVDVLYNGLTPRLVDAACGCVCAHLELLAKQPNATFVAQIDHPVAQSVTG